MVMLRLFFISIIAFVLLPYGCERKDQDIPRNVKIELDAGYSVESIKLYYFTKEKQEVSTRFLKKDGGIYTVTLIIEEGTTLCFNAYILSSYDLQPSVWAVNNGEITVKSIKVNDIEINNANIASSNISDVVKEFICFEI